MGAMLLSMIGQMCARSGLPVAECLRNPYTVLATTRRGGHCAHLQVRRPLPLYPVHQSDAKLEAATLLHLARPVGGNY